jgi:hypothetical protein
MNAVDQRAIHIDLLIRIERLLSEADAVRILRDRLLRIERERQYAERQEPTRKSFDLPAGTTSGNAQ